MRGQMTTHRALPGRWELWSSITWHSSQVTLPTIPGDREGGQAAQPTPGTPPLPAPHRHRVPPPGRAGHHLALTDPCCPSQTVPALTDTSRERCTTSPGLLQLLPTHTLPTHVEQHQQNHQGSAVPWVGWEVSLNSLQQQKETNPHTPLI